jgi:uncharacterized protein YciI
MKSILSCISILTFLMLLIACQPQGNSTAHEVSANENATGFDSTLAIKTGADEHGMKHYVMAFLKAGPNRDQDSITRIEIQKGHMANIQRLADEGKLVLAGPFEDEGDIRGIFVFNVTSVEEAKALTETDPAIQAGRLVMELHPWYGSAAIMEVNALHEKVAKANF